MTSWARWISDHQPYDFLLYHLFRRWSKKTTILRVTGFCRGAHRWPANFPYTGPVTRKMFPFDDVIMWKISISHQMSTESNVILPGHYLAPWAPGQNGVQFQQLDFDIQFYNWLLEHYNGERIRIYVCGVTEYKLAFRQVMLWSFYLIIYWSKSTMPRGVPGLQWNE